MKKEKYNYLWTAVFVLLVSVVVSTSIYISHLLAMLPNENSEVIVLASEENAEVSEAIPVEISKVSSPQTMYGGSITSEKRQVGLMEAQMQTEDEVQVWTTETKINLFHEYYKGANDETTVANASGDGWNLIAPGTGSEYTFWVKNTGAVGIDYQISFEENGTNGYEIPLEVRVKYGNQYIFGDEDCWEEIDKIESLIHEGSLNVKNYARYTLEWRWPYDADDRLDTYLGDAAVRDILEQELIIHTYGEGYDRPIYETLTVMGIQTGDSANIMCWIVLMLGACFMFYSVRKLSAKHYRKEEQKCE